MSTDLVQEMEKADIRLSFLDKKKRRITGDNLSVIRGWRSTLLVQFEPQFQATINLGALVGFVAALVDLVYILANSKIHRSELRYYCKFITVF